MRRERVTIGRKEISYLTTTPSVPPVRQHPLRTVVLLHAFPLQAAMWEPNLDATPDGWQVVAPDLCGFGHSFLPESDSHPMTEFAGDVIDLLDRLEVTDAAVVGCSMGGYVLFEMLKSAPRYVSAVVLVSTRPGPDSEEGRRNREKMIEQVEREGVDAIAGQMAPKLLGTTSQRERPEVMTRVRDLITTNRRDGVKTAIKAMMDRSDSTPALDRIKVPTLIVAGVEDTLIPPAEAEAMHRAVPHSQCELMPLAGHLPNMEQPRAFEALLWQFLHRL